MSYATSLKFWGYGLLATIGFVGAWKWSEDFFNDVVNVKQGKGWYNLDDISIYDEKYLANDRGLNSDGTPLEKKS